MKDIKYLIKGFLISLVILLALPVFMVLFVIDMLFIVGGQDPYDTPIRKIVDKYL